MRKDSLVGIALIILYFAALLFVLDGAFRRGADDASWEVHWRILDAAGRARVATAAHSRGSGAELRPDELNLADGYRRRRRRRRSYIDLAMSPLVIIATALALAGVVGIGLVGVILGASAVVTGFCDHRRERQMDGRLRAAVEAEATL